MSKCLDPTYSLWTLKDRIVKGAPNVISSTCEQEPHPLELSHKGKWLLDCLLLEP